MRLNIGTKLFLSYLLILLVGMLILVIGSQVSLPGAYGRHLGMMNAAGMMGTGPGRIQAGVAGAAYLGFRTGFYEALGWAGLSALIVASIVSLFISRGLVAPLRAMQAASHRVSQGHFSERVSARGSDELAQLGASFNSMAEKLEQVETMRRRLIGDVAHELRTPLTAIKGSMEALVDGVMPASPETFTQVGQEAERLSRLVDDLQELSRVESGTLALEFGPVSLSDLSETVRKRLYGAFKAKGVTLTLDLPENLPRVRADMDRLLQVLTNLLDNALKYTSAGGSVTLSGEKHNHEINVHISDTGIGIPPEHLPFIFDRFYRVDKSRSRKSGGGSGIGLTISRYLIEAQDGRIWVESAGDGHGSTFSFTLPLA